MATRIMHGSVLNLEGIRKGDCVRVSIKPPMYLSGFNGGDPEVLKLNLALNKALMIIFSPDNDVTSVSIEELGGKYTSLTNNTLDDNTMIYFVKKLGYKVTEEDFVLRKEPQPAVES